MQATSETVRLLRSNPVWEKANDLRLRQLLAAGADVKLAPKQLLLRRGDRAESVFVLVEGSVRVFFPRSRNKREVTAKLFDAPAYFGEESVVGDRFAVSVEALSPARVFVFPVRDYLAVLRLEPEACFRQYLDVTQRFVMLVRARSVFELEVFTPRLVALLLTYARVFGKPRHGGVFIDFPLPQDEIAEQTGFSRRNVVRALSELYRAKLVKRVGRQFVLLDVDRLKSYLPEPVVLASRMGRD